MSWLVKLWNWLTSRHLPWYAFHVVGLALALALAFGVSRRFDLPAALVSPLPRLHAVWLPGLGLLAYALGWLAYLFGRWSAESRGDADEELLAAWDGALARVRAAGIDLTDTPLILVLGRPAGGVGDLFAATGGDYAIRSAPRAGAPVELFATKQAVFVAANLGALAAVCDHAPASLPLPAPAARPPADLLDALEPEAEPEAVGAEPDTADWLPLPSAAETRTDPESAKRLGSLARLVAHARRPFCPANGILWLVPARLTTDAASASRAARAAAADRAAVDLAWGLELPQTVVVTDAESVPGFRELAESVPPAARADRLFGVTFPLNPGGGAADRAGMVAAGVDWLTRNMAGGLVAHRLSAGGDQAQAAWRAFAEWTRRGPHLARLVAEGMLPAPDRPARLASIALAGTGPDAADRLFAAAPLAGAVASENAVAWTRTALAADAAARRLAIGVWILIAVGAAGLVALAVR